MLRLHNTLSGQVETVSSNNKEHSFGMYCCGPTVYGPAHIGNFRTYLVQDVLFRLLKTLGFKVTYVRNITDVDDKTIRHSQMEGVSLKSFTKKWYEKFINDSERLNLLPPTIEPKATEHIQDQIDLITTLQRKGYAYQSDEGSVYFRLKSFKQYGRLSKIEFRQLETQSTNSAGSVNNVDEYDRESIGDFALWKAYKPSDGDVFWESPWGKGRPGWHIECSAMSNRYLGKTIDLHAGGIDLCFPHHENEIAQSEAANEETFVRHWLHVAHLQVDGQKMSKSLGNLYTLADIEKYGYGPQILRYALLTGHYRHPLNFTFDLLHASKNALARMGRWLNNLLDIGQRRIDDLEFHSVPLEWQNLKEVWQALLDDLNIPKALGLLFTQINNPNFKPNNMDCFVEEMSAILYVLGVSTRDFEEKAIAIPEAIKVLAEQRWKAKCDRRFSEADQLRQQLETEGWQVLDKKDTYSILPR